MILPLLNSEGQYCLLDVQEIIYLQTNGRGELLLYSYDETYKMITMLRDWSTLLHKSGFIQMERGTVVNERKITSYDPHLHVVRILTSGGEVSIPVSEKIHRKIKTQFSLPSEMNIKTDQ
jgi:DNA-binding LytR/AlgR family response regulator